MPDKGPVAARRARAVVIFPRFRQCDAVLKPDGDAAANGAGHSYPIQHSAGSGKSNTIAWFQNRAKRTYASRHGHTSER